MNSTPFVWLLILQLMFISPIVSIFSHVTVFNFTCVGRMFCLFPPCFIFKIKRRVFWFAKTSLMILYIFCLFLFTTSIVLYSRTLRTTLLYKSLNSLRNHSLINWISPIFHLYVPLVPRKGWTISLLIK